MSSVDETLLQLGFLKTYQVKGRATVADLFRPSRRCGIYVLHFSNGQHYVGKAVDVVRRYAQHRHTHTDIEKISFKRVAVSKLDAEEKATVRAVEIYGFRLRNIQLVSFSYGETDFDLIMSPEDQERWLNDLSYQDLAGERVVDELQRSRYRQRFLQFEQMPLAREIIRVLHEYIRNCVPAIKRGEKSFWICSCLPNNSKMLYSRINLGWQTTLEAYVYEGKRLFRWCLTRFMAEQVFELSLQQVNREFEMVISFENYTEMEVVVEKSGLTQGGQDQVWINVFGSENALRLIQDSYMLAAIRVFNLGLLQKGPCPYGRNHCLDLADKLIESS